MFCPNCGQQANANNKFCENCGQPLDINIPNNSSNGEVVNTPKKVNKKAVAIALIIPLIFIILIVGSIGFVAWLVFSSLGDIQTKEYIEFGDAEIPTVYSVLGEKNVCSYNSETTYSGKVVHYQYCDGELNYDEYNKYISYLLENEDFLGSNTNSYVVLQKDADDEQTILVKIDKANNEIVYSIISGSIKDNYNEDSA